MTDKPSKSARKREHRALQDLGAQLAALPEKTLRGMPLEPELLDALLDAGRMSSHGALRRQQRLLGKLLAQGDPGPIREALRSLQRKDRQHEALFRETEQWRDRVVREGSAAVDDFAARSGADTAGLAALVRELDGCRNEARRRRVLRQIFRWLRAALDANVQRGRF